VTPRLVVFLAVFFRKFDKKSQNVTVRGVTVRESLPVYSTVGHISFERCPIKTASFGYIVKFKLGTTFSKLNHVTF